MTTESSPTTVTVESLAELFDVARYPIGNPKGLVRASLVKSCRGQLAETRYARLQTFIKVFGRWGNSAEQKIFSETPGTDDSPGIEELAQV